MLKLRQASDLKPLVLNPKASLGAGGEGDVFAAGNHLAAKIYRKPSQVTQQKLRAMLAQTAATSLAKQDLSVAWPIDLLLDEADQIVGFLMPQAVAARPIVDYYNPKTRLGFSPFFNYRYLHRAARNLAVAVENLHSRGYVIGDLNESNILVTETAQVTLVDADSIQVIDGDTVYRCRVGKAEFMPPELQGKTLSEVARTTEQDNFALAILIFQTLMEGSHPFAGIYTEEGEPPTLAERIAVGHFPYSEQSVPYRPSPLALPFTLLHPKLQEYFRYCFIDSQQDPSVRPTAAQWSVALTLAEQELQICKVNARHTYGSHLDSCPWCYRKALLKDRDPFPEKIEFPKPEPAAKKERKGPILGIFFGVPLAFIAVIFILLLLGSLVSRNSQINSIREEVPAPKDHLRTKSKKSDSNKYRIYTFHPDKLQVSFCKSETRLSFPENLDLAALKGFEPNCPRSPLKLMSLVYSGKIFKEVFDYPDIVSLTSRYQDSLLVSSNEGQPSFSTAEAFKSSTLSPNGLYFASITSEINNRNYNYILLFDVRTNKVLRRIGDEGGTISSIAFSPDSKKIGVVLHNGLIKVYNTESGAFISKIYILDPYVDSLKFLKDGKILCVGGGKGYQLLRADSGRIISVFGRSNRPSNAIYPDNTEKIAFSPNEKMVALADDVNGTIVIHEALTGKVLRTLDFGEYPTLVFFSKDSKKLAIGDGSGNIRIYNTNL